MYLSYQDCVTRLELPTPRRGPAVDNTPNARKTVVTPRDLNPEPALSNPMSTRAHTRERDTRTHTYHLWFGRSRLRLDMLLRLLYLHLLHLLLQMELLLLLDMNRRLIAVFHWSEIQLLKI